MSVIALDIGGRYIGIAALDHAGEITYRHSTIDRKEQDAFEVLQDICDTEDVDTIVAGVPYHVEDGSETEQTSITRAFITELKDRLTMPVDIVEIDETLTSQEARSRLRVEGAAVSEEHAEAARLLLAEYLAQ